MKLFYEQESSAYFATRLRRALDRVEDESEEYLFGVDQDEYVKFLLDLVLITDFEVHWDVLSISRTEKMIPAEHFPSHMFTVTHGKSYKRTVYRFHVPFTGDPQLLELKPSTRYMNFRMAEVSNNEITFDVVDFYCEKEKIEQEKNGFISLFRKQYNNLVQDVLSFNSDAERKIREAVGTRKGKIVADYDLMSSLDVPIRRRDCVPKTFAVPRPVLRKKIVFPKPAAKPARFTQEPALADRIYQEILLIIQDVGKQFERTPKIFSGKNEENLRDHILLCLEPNFEGSATGETFNRAGKTDILLRHEGSNVFIAECKFWAGKKAYLQTIDQLLSYLTWRDSKASIIIFVRQKNLSKILQIVKDETPKHIRFHSYVDSKDDTWLNYKFSFKGDEERLIYVAVQLFNVQS